MSLIPSNKAAKVAFFNSLIAPWTTNATAIGTTAGAVTALNTLTTTAQTKLAAQVTAENAAKAATATADSAIAAMVAAGSDIIKNIRAKAANSADPNTVYDLAQIPAPATPTPVNTLGQPTDFKVALGADGALTLVWKCANPRATGTFYQVYRRLGGTGEFAFLGGTGEKKFVDPSVPSGSAMVVYKIQAVRSTAVGPWAVFTVLIGVGSSGEMTASLESAPKLAA